MTSLICCQNDVALGSSQISLDHDPLELKDLGKTLTPLPLYDWSAHLKMTHDPKGYGHQVMHFSANKDKDYIKDEDAKAFVETYCSQAKRFKTDADTIRFASDSISKNSEGVIVELGTGAAKTTNFLAALNPTKVLYTFDSFEGLPEDWDKGTRVIEKGTFASHNPTYQPAVLNNVQIFRGWFKDTLSEFKKLILKKQPIALLNVDSDIYSAAKDAFNILGNNVGPGTIIYFDELYNYPKFQEGEWKAFQEFIKQKEYKFKVIGFNEMHEQVVVRIE